MSIQELLDDHELEFDGFTNKCCISKNELSEMMKEYAIIMCQKQKEICSEEAETRDIHPNGSYLTHMVIDNNSILNSPFPEELQNEN